MSETALHKAFLNICHVTSFVTLIHLEEKLNKIVFTIDTGNTKWRTSSWWEQTSGITVTVSGQQHSQRAERQSNERGGWWALERPALHIFQRLIPFCYTVFLIYLYCHNSTKNACHGRFSPTCVQKKCSGKSKVAWEASRHWVRVLSFSSLLHKTSSFHQVSSFLHLYSFILFLKF